MKYFKKPFKKKFRSAIDAARFLTNSDMNMILYKNNIEKSQYLINNISIIPTENEQSDYLEVQLTITFRTY